VTIFWAPLPSPGSLVSVECDQPPLICFGVCEREATSVSTCSRGVYPSCHPQSRIIVDFKLFFSFLLRQPTLNSAHQFQRDDSISIFWRILWFDDIWPPSPLISFSLFHVFRVIDVYHDTQNLSTPYLRNNNYVTGYDMEGRSWKSSNADMLVSAFSCIDHMDYFDRSTGSSVRFIWRWHNILLAVFLSSRILCFRRLTSSLDWRFWVWVSESVQLFITSNVPSFARVGPHTLPQPWPWTLTLTTGSLLFPLSLRKVWSKSRTLFFVYFNS
jgi:hypothetical protein